MGRHSAPDEPDDDAPDTADPALIVDLAPPRGRHWRGGDADDPDEQHTAVIGVIDADLAADPDGHSQDTDVLPPIGPDYHPPEDTAAAEPPLIVALPGQEPEPEASEAAEAVEVPDDTKAARKAQRDAERARKKADRAAGKTERGESNTQADLRMLRENSAVRARCIAAVVASFLIYTVVLLVIGRTDIYLMWIWIPIVLSGVLVGLFLDLAHRKTVHSSG